MGNSQASLKVLDIPLKGLKNNCYIQKSSYVQPFRQFLSQYHKKSSGLQHETVLNIKYPQQGLVISLGQVRYKQIQQAYQQKTKNFQILSIIFDQYYNDRVLYLVNDSNVKKSILLRVFDKYQSHVFDNIVCQVKINEQISNFVGNNILKMTDNYIIQSGPIRFSNSTTQILQLQPVEASLSQIIEYRRQNNWQWNQTQFNQLVYDLITSINIIHSNNITHNDIRPQNIYYSITKKCYVLGQFAYGSKGVIKGNLRNNRASVNYTAPQVNIKQQYDFKKADIYALGMALLCALFLSNPINISCIKQSKNRFNNIKGYRLILQMLKPQQQRKSIYQLHSLLSNPEYVNNNMSILIQSLRYKTKPRNKYHNVYMQISSEFYKRLGLWDDWRNQIDQLLQSDHTLNKYQSAILYQQLALVDYCQDQLDQSTMNAKIAAKIYREMGQQALKQNDLNLSSKYFTSAVECSKYYINKYDLDLAKSLLCLSRVHAEKRQQDYSRTLLLQAKDLVAKQSSSQSILYCQMLIKQADLNRKFFKYEQSIIYLNQALQISKKIQQLNEKSSKLTQAKILTLLALNEILLSQKLDNNSVQKGEYLDKAQIHLNNSKNIYESITTSDNHLQLCYNTQVLGQLYLQKHQYQMSRLCFQKSLQMRQWYQQKNNLSTIIIQNAHTLSNLGRCQRLMNQSQQIEIYKQSLRHQQQSLEILKKVYGSDHNYYSACVLKQMGILYNQMNNISQARQCFACSKQIMNDLFGQKSPYDQIKQHQKMFKNQP